MEALLQRGASVCVRDIQGRSPLHLASACGRVAALGALLQATSTPNTDTHLTDNQGYTPLHWASYNGTGAGCGPDVCVCVCVRRDYNTPPLVFLCLQVMMPVLKCCWTRRCSGRLRATHSVHSTVPCKTPFSIQFECGKKLKCRCGLERGRHLFFLQIILFINTF